MEEMKGKFNVVFSDFVNVLLEGIWKLYNDEDGADLTLRCNGCELKIHRWLIRIVAPQLLHEETFTDNNCLPINSALNVKGMKISMEILKLAMEFVYRGRIDVENEQKLEQLREAAENMRLETLVTSIDKVRSSVNDKRVTTDAELSDNDSDWQPDSDAVQSPIEPRQVENEEELVTAEVKVRSEVRLTRRIFNMRCIHCEFLTQDRIEYVRHVTQAHPAGDRSRCRCAHCEFVGPHKRALRSHWRETHRAGRQTKFRCGECNFVAVKKILLDRHVHNEHSTDRPFSCDQCDYRATKMVNLKYHQKRHEGREFVCETCGKKCTSVSGLCKHRKIHTGYDKPYVCHICHFPFRMRTTLNLHLIDIHRQPGVQRPPNESRGRPKKKQSDVQTRKKQRDGSTKRFRCEECDFATRIQTNLDLHVRTRHRNEKPFTCEKCGYNTKTMNSLRSHLSIHLNQKVACDICHKSYSSKAKLKRHLVVMHDPQARRFMCHYCGFATKTNDALTQHMRRRHKDETSQL